MSAQPSTPSVDWYEDEIDLRELVLTLWRGKWIIVLTTLLFAVAALAVSLALPKQYQAKANITLVQPKLQLNAPEGMALQVAVPDLKTVAAVAQAPELFQRLAADEVIQAAWLNEKEPLTWQRLAGKSAVKEQGKDGLQLLIKDTDPERAALIANYWSALVVKWINERYGWAALQVQFDSQVEDIQQAYKQAQMAYEKEVSCNRATALQAQLDHVKRDLNCVLELQSQLERLQEDVATFADYLSNLDGATALLPGDALSLATLQQRTLVAKVCVSDTASLQVQWPPNALTSLTVERARNGLQEMEAALHGRLETLPERQASLEKQIGQLEQALEEEQARLDSARQRRDMAWQTYVSLDLLRSQSQPLALPENQVALVAAEAVKPERPIAPRKLMNTALAAMLGLFLGSIGIFVREWWTNEENETEGENED